MENQLEMHEKTLSPISNERIDALQQLTVFFKSLPDRPQALEDIFRLCSDKDKTLRIKAIDSLGTIFPELSDEEKEKSWNSLLGLAKAEDREVLKTVVLSLVFAFGNMPEKEKAWNFLLRLAEDENSHIREYAVEALILLFPSMPEKEKVWADFIALARSEHEEIRRLASDAFILVYPYLEDRKKVWKSLLKWQREVTTMCGTGQEISWHGSSTSSLTRKKPCLMLKT